MNTAPAAPLPSMTCAEAEPLLPLVADGALGPDEDPALFAHLAACERCQAALALHDLVTLSVETAPPQRPSVVRFRVPWYLSAAALVLIGVGLGSWWWHAAPAAPAAPARARVEVVRVLPPADGSDQPRYLVRCEGREFVVDTLDGRPADTDGPAAGALVPVGSR